jgi:hypothetical protein
MDGGGIGMAVVESPTAAVVTGQVSKYHAARFLEQDIGHTGR